MGVFFLARYPCWLVRICCSQYIGAFDLLGVNYDPLSRRGIQGYLALKQPPPPRTLR